MKTAGSRGCTGRAKAGRKAGREGAAARQRLPNSSGIPPSSSLLFLSESASGASVGETPSGSSPKPGVPSAGLSARSPRPSRPPPPPLRPPAARSRPRCPSRGHGAPGCPAADACQHLNPGTTAAASEPSPLQRRLRPALPTPLPALVPAEGAAGAVAAAGSRRAPGAKRRAARGIARSRLRRSPAVAPPARPVPAGPVPAAAPREVGPGGGRERRRCGSAGLCAELGAELCAALLPGAPLGAALTSAGGGGDTFFPSPPVPVPGSPLPSWLSQAAPLLARLLFAGAL